MNMGIPIWPTTAYIIIGDKLIFPHGMINVLMEYDLRTNELIYLSSIDGMKISYDCPLFTDVVKYDQKLYLVPYYADGIVIYDISKNKMNRIDINKGKAAQYIRGFEKEGYIYLIPHYRSEKILRVCCESNVVEKCDIDLLDYPIDCYCIDSVDKKIGGFSGCYIGTNSMFHYRIYENKCTNIELIGLPGRITSAIYIGNRYYVHTNNDKIVYEYDADLNLINKYVIQFDNFILIIGTQNHVVVDSYDGRGIAVIDLKSGKIEYHYNDKNIEESIFNYKYCTGIAFNFNGNDYYYSRVYNSIRNIENGEINVPVLKKEDLSAINRVVETDYSDMGLFYETNSCGLNGFLEFINNTDK